MFVYYTFTGNFAQAQPVFSSRVTPD